MQIISFKTDSYIYTEIEKYFVVNDDENNIRSFQTQILFLFEFHMIELNRLFANLEMSVILWNLL